MTDPHDGSEIERRLPQALHAAAPPPSTDLADRLLRRTAETPQRRPLLSGAVVTALSFAAVAVVAAFIGLQLGGLARETPPPVGGEPSGSAPPSLTASPSATVAPGMVRCENPTDGYTVQYPTDWHANPPVPAPSGLDPVAPCRFFGEEPFEVRPNAGLPSSVAISFQLVPDVRPEGGTLRGESITTTVDGREAIAREVDIGEGVFMPPGTLVYEWFIELADGQFLLVSTDSSRDGDYAAHQAVLDRMMETLQLD